MSENGDEFGIPIHTFDKSRRRRVSFHIQEYKGTEFLDVREFYQERETEEWKPTRKGITIAPYLLPEFVAGVVQAVEALGLDGLWTGPTMMKGTTRPGASPYQLGTIRTGAAGVRIPVPVRHASRHRLWFQSTMVVKRAADARASLNLGAYLAAWCFLVDRPMMQVSIV